jgi:hypothetical protein
MSARIDEDQGGRSRQEWRPCLTSPNPWSSTSIPESTVVSISRLRPMGVITSETTDFLVQLVHVEKKVSVRLRRFPSGGSWSWFGCPTCGKWVRTLRLLGDEIVCRDCGERRRVRHRACTMSPRQRAERRITQIKAMLESKESLRLKPVLWGKMERRSRLEAALRRCEFIVARGRGYSRKAAAIVDPCEEPDFKPPRRPWPGLKSKLSDSG